VKKEVAERWKRGAQGAETNAEGLRENRGAVGPDGDGNGERVFLSPTD